MQPKFNLNKIITALEDAPFIGKVELLLSAE